MSINPGARQWRIRQQALAYRGLAL